MSTVTDALLPPGRWAMPAWLRAAFVQVAIWGLLLGMWQFVVETAPGAESLVGSPAGVASQLADWFSDPQFGRNIVQTLVGSGIGFLLGTAAACVAIAITWPSALLREFLAPFLVLANAIPRVALAPLFILWFGIGTTSTAFFVATLIFLIVYLNVFTGLSSIDRVFVHNAKVLGANRRQLAATVYIPAVASWLVTSLRLAVVWAILGAALAEYLAGSTGLGAYLSRGNILGEPEMLVGAATVIALLSLAADRILVLLERRYTTWRLF